MTRHEYSGMLGLLRKRAEAYTPPEAQRMVRALRALRGNKDAFWEGHKERLQSAFKTRTQGER